MAVIWAAALDKGPAVFTGQGASNFSRLEAPDPVRQAQFSTMDGFPTVRFECRYGDQFFDPHSQTYFTEQRSLADVGQIVLHEGDEAAVSLRLQVPADWRGWEPKHDELDTYVVRGGQAGRVDGGMFFEWHHGPVNGNWSDPGFPGSAPAALHGTGDAYHFHLVDPAIGGRPDASWDVAPINRGYFQDVIVHMKFSVDPAAGFVELFDFTGKVLVPRKTTWTMYGPPRYIETYVYPVFGLYRRVDIGNPALLWPSDPPGGVSYPYGFAPRKGTRVYPRDDKYPQAVFHQRLKIATGPTCVRDLLTVLAAETGGTPMPTPPAPMTQPATASAPEWLWKPDKTGLRGQLDAAVDAADAQVAAAKAQLTAAQQQLTAAQTSRDALAATRDQLLVRLNRGTAWLSP